MTTNLNQPAISLQEHPVSQKIAKGSWRNRAHKTMALCIAAVILLAIIGVGLYFWSPWKQSAYSLPTSATSQANFTVYFYDNTLPSDFVLNKDSVAYSDGVLSLTMANSKGSVYIIQQAAPKQQIKLETLPGFKPLGTTLGQAVIGKVDGKQTVILMTDTSLINITADSGITAPVVTNLVRKLVQLPHTG